MQASKNHCYRFLVSAALVVALAGCSRAPETAAVSAPVAPPVVDAPPVQAPPAVAAAPAEPAPPPAPVVQSRPKPRVAAVRPAPRPVDSDAVAAAPAPVVASAPPPPPPVCHNCGVVTDIKDVRVAGQGSGLGAVLGGVAGLVVGNQIGGGNGKTLAKVAGAAGGAYAGNAVEKRARGTMTYEVTVRLDNGGTRTVTLDHEPGFANGAAVRVVDGNNVVAR